MNITLRNLRQLTNPKTFTAEKRPAKDSVVLLAFPTYDTRRLGCEGRPWLKNGSLGLVLANTENCVKVRFRGTDMVDLVHPSFLCQVPAFLKTSE